MLLSQRKEEKDRTKQEEKRKELKNKTFEIQNIYAEAGYDPTKSNSETHQESSTNNEENPPNNRPPKKFNKQFEGKKPLFVQAQEKYNTKKAERLVYLIYRFGQRCWILIIFLRNTRDIKNIEKLGK